MRLYLRVTPETLVPLCSDCEGDASLGGLAKFSDSPETVVLCFSCFDLYGSQVETIARWDLDPIPTPEGLTEALTK